VQLENIASIADRSQTSADQDTIEHENSSQTESSSEALSLHVPTTNLIDITDGTVEPEQVLDDDPLYT
jgi:hypothetical protein